MTVLNALFVYPFEVCMGTIFYSVFSVTQSCVFALGCVCIVINTLLLPIYIKAFKWQKKEHELKIRIRPKARMIRRCFKGQERFAMMATMRRQAGLSYLKSYASNIGIFLQLLIFVASINVFSNISTINGITFGPIHNLGASDSILPLGDVSINLLPILMLAAGLCILICLLHTISYTELIIILLILLIIFVLLYNSIAVLTLYWTMNNIYFLIQLIIHKFITSSSRRILST